MGRLEDYQKAFIAFLIESGALQFGAFRTKSGRETPYFINTGRFNTGDQIAKLGSFYATHIKKVISPLPTVIFGPAYKGVPLAVSTSQALYIDHKISTYYSFDRKEEKDHGDKGNYVGHNPVANDRVLIVEDVVTAGTTLRKIVPELKKIEGVKVCGVVIAVDRCEVGINSNSSAVKEAEESLDIEIFPLVTIHDIKAYLSTPEAGNARLDDSLLHNIDSYLAVYGAS